MALKNEKEKARQLRKSRWWQTLIQDSACYYCNKKLKKQETTMDHIIPLSRGGKSNRSNTVVCCKECNNTKSNKTAAELLLEKLPSNHK